MRKFAVLTLAVAVASLGVAAVAGAGASFNTKLTIHFNDDGNVFSGLVKSTKGKCERNRKVRLFLKDDEGTNDVFLDNDTSNEDGEWTIDKNLVIFNREYYAKAKRRVLDSGICKKDRSRDVLID